ncbi:MAG: hypothetical protein ACOX7P_10115 [Oscillospiraceae bacterium]|jgi:hypothetical protein
MKPGQNSGFKLTYTFSYLYLGLPILLFLLGWVRPALSIPLSLALIYGLYSSIKNSPESDLNLYEDRKKLIAAFCILLIWVISSGIGGLAWQNRWDHMYRNAVFRDLVKYDWPVINTDSGTERSLCYYLGFWLPSALIGKLNYQVGYVFQLVWAFAGAALAFCLISRWLKKVSVRAAVILVFFSGLDIVSYIIYKFTIGRMDTLIDNIIAGTHIELTLNYFNSSSNTTLIYWLYNQTIPFWVCFMLLLMQKNNKCRLFTFMLMLLFSPFSAFALIPAVIYLIFREAGPAKRGLKENALNLIKSALTFENIVGFLVMIIISLYFMSNRSANVRHFLPLDAKAVLKFILYLATEYGVYLFFVYRDAKEDVLFRIFFIVMVVCSFIVVGHYYDFAWRTCIPTAFYLMLMVMRHVVHDRETQKWKKRLLLVVFLVGCFTPGMEMIRTVRHTAICYSAGQYSELTSGGLDSVFDDSYFYDNFIGSGDSAFNKYLMRRP